MRLTAGSYRELHWHTSDEWTIVFTGTTRVTLMQPDGRCLSMMLQRAISGTSRPAIRIRFKALARTVQTSSWSLMTVRFQRKYVFISESLVHTPPEVIQKNMGWNMDSFNKLPSTQLYLFPSTESASLEEDKHALGDGLETVNQYTYKLSQQKPDVVHTGGSLKLVDVTRFPIANKICATQVTLKPGGLRKMHWHPNSDEWQYWIRGKGRMTIASTGARTRTMDFNANDGALFL